MTKIFQHLRGDIFGGVTAGIVALPLALAFGIYSGMGATAGLYGAIVLGFFAALLGGTSVQVSGPTGPMSVISAAIIAEAYQLMGSLPAALNIILITFALAGLIQIGMGLLRMGQYIRYIPYPVISGFMTGIGVIIILLQLYPILGLDAPDNTLAVFKSLHHALLNIHWKSLIIGLSTIAIIYLFPKITRVIPSTLIALIAMTLICAYWDIPIKTIGDIPKGWPELKLSTIFQLPSTAHYTFIITSALTLAALGAIDSLLTSVVVDNLTKTRHKSNQELIGQGIGNTLAACVGGLPGAGATMRTLVNLNSGAKTRLSGMIHSIVLLLILLCFSGYAATIPLAVLSGILITVGIGIIDYRSIKHIFHVPIEDSLVILIVLALTVFVNLLQAVIVGFVLASILFMKKMGDISGKLSYAKHFDESTQDHLKNNIYIKHLEGPLFFGFTSQFQQMVQEVPKVKYVIIRMKGVPYMDQTGLYAMEDAVMTLQQKGITVYITEIQEQPLDMLMRIKLIPGLINKTQVFDTFDQCIQTLI